MNTLINRLFVACICGFLLACGGSSSTDDGLTVPPAPVSLSVEPGDAVNIVQWPAVAGVLSYNLYWTETLPITKETAQVVNGAVSPFQHTGLTNGKHIYYAVAAVNAEGESALSWEIGAMPVAPLPASPETIVATPSDQRVTVNWTTVAGASSYNIYWSTSPDFVPGGSGVAQISALQGNSYSHTGLTNGETYYYAVTAMNMAGESRASSQASARPMAPEPGAPTNLSATTGDMQVQLSWSASENALSYNVYWANVSGVAPGAAGVTQIPAVAAASYVHTGVSNTETYYYVVTAIGPGGESAPSAEASARPLAPPPPAPLGLTAIAPKDTTEVTVQWLDVAEYPSAAAPVELGYNLYRGEQPGLASYYKDASRATKFADVTAAHTDSTVVKGSTYYYVVTAFVLTASDIESAPSGEASATVGEVGSGHAGGMGGHTTGFGNNLSFPLILADNIGVTGAKLAGTWPGAGPFTSFPTLDFNTGLRPLSPGVMQVFPYNEGSSSVSIGGIRYYPQATASTWQAQWRGNPEGAEIKAVVDWGDALSSRTYTASSMARIEVSLVQDETVITDPTDTMLAYRMMRLSGSRNTEIQGTDGTSFASLVRTVFAVNARLRIEKISDVPGVPDALVFDKAIYETLGHSEEEGGHTEGGDEGSAESGGPPLKFSAEINGAGKLIYGANLRLPSAALPADMPKVGRWRLTLTLDPSATVGTETTTNHVRMVGAKDAKAVVAADGMSSSIVFNVR